MTPTKSIYPYLALGAGVLALSMSALFVRWAQAPGLVTSFYRMSIAAVLLLPLIASAVRARGLPPLRWMLFPALGGIFTALDHGAWSTAIGSTRIANATLLNNLAPVWVALFAVLIWRERLGGKFWLGLAVTMAGAAVVLGSDMVYAPELNGGNLLAIFSSLAYAAYFLVTQRGRTRLDVLAYVWLVDVFAALSLLGMVRGLNMPLSGFDTPTWLIFLAAALISQVGGYFSIAFALGHLPASVVSPTMILQPVLTALLAIPFTGEILSPVQWLGGLAVLGGVFWVNRSRGAT